MPVAADERRAAAPSIALVVARSRPGNVIGRDNALPWQLKSDLRRFRAITLDHAIVMGRKTHESIGRPLPRRANVVVSSAAMAATRHAAPALDGAAIWVPDIGKAMAVAQAYSTLHGQAQYFVIGGSGIFRQFLDAGLVDRIHLTEVCAPELQGDARFADEFLPEEWQPTQVETLPAGPGDDYPSVYRVLERRTPCHTRGQKRPRSEEFTR